MNNSKAVNTELKEQGLGILNTTAPFSSIAGKEALDIALIFGSFEQAVSLFFQGDGVYQLIGNQQAEKISTKNYLKTFSAFEFYDIDTVYVCKNSLIKRNLANDFHIENVTLLSKDEFAIRLKQHQHILRF